MTLSSLPPTLDHSNLTYREKVSDVHVTISSMLAHMFIMKMDWMTSKGLPCDGYTQIRKTRRLYSRLVNSWQSLSCLYQRSVLEEKVSTLSTELKTNLAMVVNTLVRRYSNCQDRRMRDCVLLEQAGDLLNRFKIFYEDG